MASSTSCMHCYSTERKGASHVFDFEGRRRRRQDVLYRTPDSNLKPEWTRHWEIYCRACQQTILVKVDSRNGL